MRVRWKIVQYEQEKPGRCRLSVQVYSSSVQFTTVLHCKLYLNVGWSCFSDRGESHGLFLSSLHLFLMSLLKPKAICQQTLLQEFVDLETPQINTELGTVAFSLFEPNKKKKKFQEVLKLEDYVPVNHLCFKYYVDTVVILCSCIDYGRY